VPRPVHLEQSVMPKKEVERTVTEQSLRTTMKQKQLNSLHCTASYNCWTPAAVSKKKAVEVETVANVGKRKKADSKRMKIIIKNITNVHVLVLG